MKRASAEGSPKVVGIRTLIVDDSEAVRTSLVAFLAWLPRLKVIGTAGDAAQALAIVGERNPQLVLIDMNMPIIDGLEASRLIRRRRPATRIVLMTMGEVDVEEHCRAASADAFLSKSRFCEQLEELVARLFPEAVCK